METKQLIEFVFIDDRINKERVTLYDGVYSGDFSLENDLHTSLGRMKYSDGSIFDGWWIDGLREGMGRLISKDGKKIYLGLWKNDEKSCGTQIFPDATNYL